MTTSCTPPPPRIVSFWRNTFRYFDNQILMGDISIRFKDARSEKTFGFNLLVQFKLNFLEKGCNEIGCIRNHCITSSMLYCSNSKFFFFFCFRNNSSSIPFIARTRDKAFSSTLVNNFL